MIRAVKADEDKLGLYARPVLKRHVDEAHDGVPVGDFRYRPIPVHPCLDRGRLQFAVGVADDRPPRPPEPHKRLLAEDTGHDLGAAADGFPGTAQVWVPRGRRGRGCRQLPSPSCFLPPPKSRTMATPFLLSSPPSSSIRARLSETRRICSRTIEWAASSRR